MVLVPIEKIVEQLVPAAKEIDKLGPGIEAIRPVIIVADCGHRNLGRTYFFSSNLLELRLVDVGQAGIFHRGFGSLKPGCVEKIPKGMVNGKKLRLAGKGEASAYGGPIGDLFIQAKVINDPLYDIDGNNLYINREIKLSESILGANISIPTLEGKELNLKIPPGTKHKTKMRLAGHGIPHMKGSGKGDLFVSILVNIPKTLTEEQIELVKKLAQTGL